MSAVLRDQRQWVPMAVGHLDAVLAIETAAYAVPWTRGNFIDSMASGYDTWLLVDAQRSLLGYFVAMEGVDEMHLLNLTVAPERQGQGLARCLLERLVELCHDRGAGDLWLEVRDSNARARLVYERFGFRQVGLRRGYYPQPPGVAGREDAVVMSLKLSESESKSE